MSADQSSLWLRNPTRWTHPPLRNWLAVGGSGCREKTKWSRHRVANSRYLHNNLSPNVQESNYIRPHLSSLRSNQFRVWIYIRWLDNWQQDEQGSCHPVQQLWVQSFWPPPPLKNVLALLPIKAHSANLLNTNANLNMLEREIQRLLDLKSMNIVEQNISVWKDFLWSQMNGQRVGYLMIFRLVICRRNLPYHTLQYKQHTILRGVLWRRPTAVQTPTQSRPG